MVQAVTKRIRTDQSEIVSKTGKKLILELQKCYPESFKKNYIENLPEGADEKKICSAILKNDDAAL